MMPTLACGHEEFRSRRVCESFEERDEEYFGSSAFSQGIMVAQNIVVRKVLPQSST